MNRITADHLARRACVYIRQSTPGQVQHNLESQRLRYALVDRARALGWQTSMLSMTIWAFRDPEHTARF